jgi:opacity protein-like surface antigen
MSMSLYRRTTLILAASAALALPAAAADYDPPIFMERAPEYVPVEIGSGWYLRGDVGYSLSTSAPDAFTYRTFDPLLSTYTTNDFATASLSDDFSFGGGVGYHFSDWLRADATLERIQTEFRGTRTDFPEDDQSTVDSASMRAYSMMLNGYVDLGTVAKVTPYAGAGVGYSYVKWSDLSSTVDDGLGGFSTASNPAVGGNWRFTYALMAGLAYDVTDKMKIDLGYKYRHIDGGDMFGWDAAVDPGATGAQGRDGGLTQHEIKVGLRYSLW